MADLAARLLEDPGVREHALARKLVGILSQPTGTTSAGYPFLQQRAWEAFRDGVPHLFTMGLRTLREVQYLDDAVQGLDAPEESKLSFRTACRVTRQIVHTAAITAPPNLWLLRHVLSFFAELGLLSRLSRGDALYPEDCRVEVSEHGSSKTVRLVAQELDADLMFLLSLGVVEQYDDGFRVAGHRRVRRMLEAIVETPPRAYPNATQLYRRLFGGELLATEEQEVLLDLAFPTPKRDSIEQNHVIPTIDEVAIGYRLVPVVLGLRAAERTESLVAGTVMTPTELSARHPMCAGGALEILTAAGWLERQGERYFVSPLGARGFARGPGPFGIIETYHPYMTRGRDILLHGRGDVWVTRGENVGASQDANRGTFERANDALDRFCDDMDFRFTVFVEHAVGRGEATRQRFARSGEQTIRYFGADLEDAAIDSAIAEQAAGRLPENMVFVRGADIGAPETLLRAFAEHGVDPEGAVMLVGNGFHEVRDQTDDGMVKVFEGYERAGILLSFTEENALSIDDLRATAWNTYHAAFRYVHDKSGQGLRPAEPRPASRLGHPLRAAWSECAQKAGYVRAEAYCARTRTIYPYTPRSGVNPSVSANHFFVPGALAKKLGL